MRELASPETLVSVFSSRHGEGSLTVELLCEIQKELPLSPMAFSRSVHNAASGILGIATGNRANTVAVSAMGLSFEMGLLQALALLQKEDRVLYIMADDIVPEDFDPYVQEPWGAYGIALLLEQGTAPLLHQPPLGQELLPPALYFLKHYLLENGGG